MKTRDERSANGQHAGVKKTVKKRKKHEKNSKKGLTSNVSPGYAFQSRAEQSRAEQSRAEQSRAEQLLTIPFFPNGRASVSALPRLLKLYIHSIHVG